MIQCCLDVVDKVLSSAEAKKVLIDALGSALEKINLMVGCNTSGVKNNQIIGSSSVPILENMDGNYDHSYYELSRVRAKG